MNGSLANIVCTSPLSLKKKVTQYLRVVDLAIEGKIPLISLLQKY